MRTAYQSLFDLAGHLSWMQERLRPASPRPSDILILTGYTPEIADYAALADENKARYAGRHGYAFQSVTSGFDRSRPAPWSKIRFIQRALLRHRWVFWTDADALVMNPAIRLESFIPSGQDIIFSETPTPYRHINTGHMFFRSCPLSFLFLEAVWRMDVFTHDPAWEQRAVNHLMEHYHFPRIAITPNRLFNSLGEVDGDPDPYQTGDFIIHFPGKSGKMELMARYAATAGVA